MNLTEKKLGMTLEKFIKLPHLEQEELLENSNNGMFIKVGANHYDEKYNVDKKIGNIFIKERKRKK